MNFIKKISVFLVIQVPIVTHEFPRKLSSYNDTNLTQISEILFNRIKEEPFNLVATLIFLLAIIHSFLTSYFLKFAHKIEEEHREKIRKGDKSNGDIKMLAKLLHFIGEIETVFGLWTIVLGFAVTYFYSWETFVSYVGGLHYTEPMFVIVVMTIASSRPIIKLFELILWKIVKLLGGTLEAWWFVILTIGPLMGSFITEPAAMTISAHLLADKIFDINPSKKLKYTTLAILFVHISVGGSLTNFAAPPILMIAGIWNWSSAYLFFHFGIKALSGILIINLIYFFIYKKELNAMKEAYAHNRFKKYIQRKFIKQEYLEEKLGKIEEDINKKLGFTETFQETCINIKNEIRKEAFESLSKEEIEKYGIENALNQRFEDIKKDEMKKSIPGLLPKDERPPYRDPNWDKREDKVPYWIMGIHIFFMIWTVVNGHEPVLFIGGFLFFLALVQVSSYYQNRIDLKPALLVAFFLAGLIIHGGVQAWWIAPVLGNLDKFPLMLSSILLTSFNDNAAITYLASLVENFPESYRYVIVAGAITGGGLTLIANAPNPAGQSILKKYFSKGISAFELFKSALIPTIIFALIFIIFGIII